MLKTLCCKCKCGSVDFSVDSTIIRENERLLRFRSAYPDGPIVPVLREEFSTRNTRQNLVYRCCHCNKAWKSTSDMFEDGTLSYIDTGKIKSWIDFLKYVKAHIRKVNMAGEDYNIRVEKNSLVLTARERERKVIRELLTYNRPYDGCTLSTKFRVADFWMDDLTCAWCVNLWGDSEIPYPVVSFSIC